MFILDYQVVSEWARVGGVLLMGYEMFRLLTNPRKSSRVSSVPSGNPFVYSGSIPLSSSTSALFPTSSPLFPDLEKPIGKKRKRPITIDIEKEEKEDHMLLGRFMSIRGLYIGAFMILSQFSIILH